MMRFARALCAATTLGVLATFIIGARTESPSSITRSGTTTQRATRTGIYSDLGGMWRFALDRGDSGVREQWFNRFLPDQIKLPGVLQSQGFGDEISTNTPWVLSLYDRYWYLRADYKAYTVARSVKVPFLSQPPRHYLGAAWYQRDIQVPTQSVNRRMGAGPRKKSQSMPAGVSISGFLPIVGRRL